MSTPPVTIYSLTTCGWSPRPRRTSASAASRLFVIEFDTAGTDLQRKIADEMRGTGRAVFPSCASAARWSRATILPASTGSCARN